VQGHAFYRIAVCRYFPIIRRPAHVDFGILLQSKQGLALAAVDLARLGFKGKGEDMVRETSAWLARRVENFRPGSTSPLDCFETLCTCGLSHLQCVAEEGMDRWSKLPEPRAATSLFAERISASVAPREHFWEWAL
jgi:hypothetical protein